MQSDDPSIEPTAKQRLRDVLDSCGAIDQYTADLDFAAYERDRKVRDAVERRLGIIGEALNRALILLQSYGIKSRSSIRSLACAIASFTDAALSTT